MSFEQLGNIGDFLGGIAVIATLIYLGLQVKKHTREARLAATRELASEFHTALDGIVHDKELLKIYRIGILDYEALQDDDRLQLGLWFMHVFRVMEQQYLHTTHGTMDNIYFTSLNKALVEMLAFPGVQRWWEFTSSMFDEGFCSHIEELIVKARAIGISSSFQNDN